MRSYFVARSEAEGYIGKYSLEEIQILAKAGQIRADHVVTVAPEGSYADLMKSGATVQWLKVGELTKLAAFIRAEYPDLPAAAGAAEQSQVDRSEGILPDTPQVQRLTGAAKLFRICAWLSGVAAAVLAAALVSRLGWPLAWGLIVFLVVAPPVMLCGRGLAMIADGVAETHRLLDRIAHR